MTTAERLSHLLVIYLTLSLVQNTALGNQENEGGDAGTRKTRPLSPCRVDFVGSFITDKENHREDYHVTSSRQDSRICQVEVQDILCQAGCQYDDPHRAFYPVLTCDKEADLQIVFTKPEGIIIRKNIVTYLHLFHCSASILDIGIVGQAVILRRARFEEVTNVDPWNHLHGKNVNTVPGLEEMVSLRFYSRHGVTSSIPHYFYTHRWPKMTAIALTRINVTDTQINSLFRAMPRLTILSIKQSTLPVIPNFPPDRQDGRHSYSLIIDNSNIANLSYPPITGRLSRISLAGDKIRKLHKDTFLGVIGLRNLTLTSNYLTELGLPEGLFRNLSELKHLDLSHNNIRSLPKGIFTGIDNLKTLRLDNNQLHIIASHTFDGFHTLELLSLSNNAIHTLENDALPYGGEDKGLRKLILASNSLSKLPLGLFRSLSGLRYLDFSHNRIRNLSMETFVGIHLLRTLKLNNNSLHKIASHTFDFHHLELLDLSNNTILSLEANALPFGNEKKGLRTLRLNSNNLTELPLGLFRNLSGLKYLDLSHNHIRNLSPLTFTGIHRLKTLRLNSNNLHKITANTFYDFHHLELLDLSENDIHTIENNAIYNGRVLETVNLQHNKLTNFPVWIFTTASIRTVNLSDNLLSFPALSMNLDGIDMEWAMEMNEEGIGQYELQDYRNVLLSQNKFTTLDVENILSNEQRRKTFRLILNFFWLDLTDNNVTCDCSTLTMAEFLNTERQKDIPNNGKKQRVLAFYYENWRCSQPLDMRGTAVADMVTCTDHAEGCPSSCDCERLTSDGPITVDCSFRNLTALPETVPNRTITLKLDRNAITYVGNLEYLDRIKYLDLSHNRIKEISDAAVQSFDKLSEVNLSHNHLNYIPPQFSHLQYVHLRLSGKFVCDCKGRWAVGWLMSYKSKISNIENIVCGPGVPKLASRPIYRENENDFVCEISKETIEAIAISIGVVMSLMFILLILGHRFRGEIKLCLYFHLKWHPFDRTDDSDVADKLYDAFVCYNKADGHWVINVLTPALEDAKKPYRLCIHERDFRPGGLVTDNVLFSVKYSRRMILVLTRNFLKSEWCRLEFISAHRRVLKDRSNYLIVILFDDLDIDGLDEDIKLYLKTNTYIEHNSRWFWQRLLYAMPEKPLAVIKQDPYPVEGYDTLFPSPESLVIMQHVDKVREKLYERARRGEVLIV